MKFRNTWILAGIVIAFGAYLYFGEYKKAAKEEEQKAADEKVLNVDQAKVVKMDIKNANGEFEVEKVDDKNWKLNIPLADVADENMITGILGSITTAKFEQAIEGQDPKNFGLDAPKSSVTVFLKDGTIKKVNVGIDSPIAGKAYLQRVDDPKILFADASFKTQLDRTLKDFRDKKIYRKAKTEIESLSIKYNTKDNHSTISLVKKGGDWHLPGENGEKADQEASNGLINTIDNLRATDFPSEKADSASELQKYGLDKPQIFIRLEDKDHKALAEISISPKKDNNVFIRVAGQNTIYQAFGGAGDQLIHVPSDFHDKKEPFDIKRDDVSEIILSYGKTNDHLIKDGVNWKLAAPDAQKEVSQIQVASLLDKIGNLRISEMTTNEKPKGLDSPRGTLMVKDAHGQDLMTLTWGDETKSKRSFFTKSSKVNYIFGTDSTALNGLTGQPLVTEKIDPKDPRRITETSGKRPEPSPGAPGASLTKPEVIDLKSAPATK